MNANFKVKFLQHLNQSKKDNEGFTLIELLVVIIIIGILAAIALPSFLNQAAKARQAEGKNNVGAVNRAQQSYRLENPAFASNFDTLKIGIPTKGNNYTFAISPAASVGSVGIQAKPNDASNVRAYAGLVSLVDGQSLAAACGEKEPKAAMPTPTVAATGPSCDGASEIIE